MKAMKITICCLVVGLLATSAPAASYVVPDDCNTIQKAINACEDGDTVVLMPGRYYGPENYNIDFKGKKITVRSTDPANGQVVSGTVIDCEHKGPGVVFKTGESTESKLAGITIIDGWGVVGGGILCLNSGPTISNCVIVGNSATFGGGIASTNGQSYPEITNCQIKENSALVYGGGVYCNGGSPTMRSCVISGNFASYGGSLYSHKPGNKPVVSNCTISGNAASTSAGGIYCYDSNGLAVYNSILWANDANYASEMLIGNLAAGASVQVAYCDIENPDDNVVCSGNCAITWGAGNMNADPCFVDIGYLNSQNVRTGGDYHLLNDSPCINAGDPTFAAGPGETDIEGSARVSGTVVDIGAYEYAVAISATVEIEPETLNLKSNGKWISCRITLADTYDITNVDLSAITLNGKLSAAWSVTDKYAGKLLVKFDRAQVQEMVKVEESPVSLVVSGKLNDGTVFEGTDTIRIIK
ncbi:MAG TPA: right-handed parallel beta-helix repeat-containing protein [Sedimentisphaerales bacterium]|nr:right-handed parallel beta-helix repeat-containing protein [Sedimentisphaerales bacterium]